MVSPDVSSKEAFLDEVNSRHSDAVAIYSTNGCQIGSYSKEVIEKLPNNIKYLCYNGASYPATWLQAGNCWCLHGLDHRVSADKLTVGAGYDKVDVEACTAKGQRCCGESPGVLAQQQPQA